MWPGLQVILQSLTPQAFDSIGRHELKIDSEPLEGKLLTVLEMQEGSIEPLSLTFDQVIQRMEDSGTIYSEGDGSFALCGDERCSADNQYITWLGRNGQLTSVQANPDWFTDAEQRSTWKIEGNLFDGTDSLDHCTLTGFAPIDQWQHLLKLIAGDAASRAVFQFQQLGIHCLPEDLFRLFDDK